MRHLSINTLRSMSFKDAGYITSKTQSRRVIQLPLVSFHFPADIIAMSAHLRFDSLPSPCPPHVGGDRAILV
jgi:hypothetical protein